MPAVRLAAPTLSTSVAFLSPNRYPPRDYSRDRPWRRSLMTDPRLYPERPYLAVSAAVIRDGRVLVVRRARAPAENLFTLPGGAVEAGESLNEAVKREIAEETGLTIEPVTLAGHR